VARMEQRASWVFSFLGTEVPDYAALLPGYVTDRDVTETGEGRLGSGRRAERAAVPPEKGGITLALLSKFHAHSLEWRNRYAFRPTGPNLIGVGVGIGIGIEPTYAESRCAKKARFPVHLPNSGNPVDAVRHEPHRSRHSPPWIIPSGSPDQSSGYRPCFT
jgi:hypothetical protein